MRVVKLTLSVFLAASLSLFLHSGRAADPATTPAQLAAKATSAKDFVYLGSGKMLECLGKGFKEDTSRTLEEAVSHFSAASKLYDEIAQSPRANSLLVRPANPIELVSWIQSKEALQGKLGAGLQTEGNVAQATITILTKLSKQLGQAKNCKHLRSDKRALLEILEDKILLERATELNEIVTAN
jgi:hypothetical protein